MSAPPKSEPRSFIFTDTIGRAEYAAMCAWNDALRRHFQREEFERLLPPRKLEPVVTYGAYERRFRLTASDMVDAYMGNVLTSVPSGKSRAYARRKITAIYCDLETSPSDGVENRNRLPLHSMDIQFDVVMYPGDIVTEEAHTVMFLACGRSETRTRRTWQPHHQHLLASTPRSPKGGH